MLHLNIIKVKTPEEMGKAPADKFEAVICRKPACDGTCHRLDAAAALPRADRA